MNETLKVIANRYYCRDFKNEVPSDEMIQAIAEAAIKAPSGMNRQAWRVIVVKDNKLIQDMESEGMSYLSNMEDTITRSVSEMWKCPKCGRELKNTEQDHFCVKPNSIDEYIAA